MFSDVITKVRFKKRRFRIEKAILYAESGFCYSLLRGDYDNILTTIDKESLVGQEVSASDWNWTTFSSYNGGVLAKLTVGEYAYDCFVTEPPDFRVDLLVFIGIFVVAFLAALA